MEVSHRYAIPKEHQTAIEIDRTRCVGCGNCHIICPMAAISLDQDGKSVVNQDECVECSTCYRVLTHNGHPWWLVCAMQGVLSIFRLAYLADVDICPTSALTPPELEWPRSVRATFGDPSMVHLGIGVAGRGTEEIKTHDVTGRLQEGEVEFVEDAGINRPVASEGYGYHKR